MPRASPIPLTKESWTISATTHSGVMASIGMADTVYTSAIKYMSQNGGQITALPRF